MKFNFKGIKFKTWLYFLVFSVAMLFILGFLLIALIKPYYRENRIAIIDTIVDSIKDNLIDNNVDQTKIDQTNKLVVGNNVCVIVLNDNGNTLYRSDSLGELCMLDEDIEFDSEIFNIENNPTKLIKKIDEVGTVNLGVNSPITGNEMLVHASKYATNLVNYYIVINTPLELLETYVSFILNQYLLVSVFIIIVALVVAFILANRITSPILKMRKEANKLAEGDYKVNFKDNDSYTEINDLAKTLDDATDKLSKVDELRKDLVANVSHDLKTPITVIQSYAEMIKDISGEDPVKRNEHLDVILHETEYLTKLITDMQEYSKMQAGYIKLNKDNFDLRECVNDVWALLDSVAREKNITIKRKLKSVIVYADELKISEVIYNFLSNAIKHSKENSRIFINIIDSEEKVRLEVVDFGDGISEEALPYVWDRYYKIDKNFNRNQNSTGLGLAIAKAILEGHKATYGVESKLNEGSTFYFELSKDFEEDNETE